MNKILIVSLLILSGCSNSEVIKEKYYCIYLVRKVCCKDIFQYGYGSKLTNCDNNVNEVLNASNIIVEEK